jgi:hypothetical protein
MWLLREFDFAVAHELDYGGVTGTAGSHQRAMRRSRLIVLQLLTGEVGERAAGFVHQKISRCKVPIVTAAGGQSRLK